MTISGPEMHRQLMDGYKVAQQRLEDMRASMSSIDNQRGDLAEDRSDALVNLAQHYLPDLTPQSIRNSWVEVRTTMTQILMRKDDERRRVSATLSETNDKRYLLEDRLFELDAELDQANTHQDELVAKVESELAADKLFVTLSGRAAKAEAALERAEDNLNEIEQDSARKLPAYEASTLFTYLRDRKYGTADYKKRGFTRRMDRWVAKYINFNQARQGYEFLVKTPEQMRQIIADDREALDTVMSDLEERRDSVANNLGLTTAVEKVDQLFKRRTEQLADLDIVRDETESLERQLTDLDDARGPHYQEAVVAFRDMLAGFDTRDLASRARRTPSITDDQIVARISGVDQALDQLDDTTRRHHDDVRDMQRCIESLGRMIQRFRASKFDSARSQFMPSVDVIDTMHRANNERDIDELWDRVRRAQRWGPTIGEKISNVAGHPVTQVLVSAMAQAAGAAMSEHARRAGRRRNQSQRHSKGPAWFGDSSGSSSDHRRRR